MEIVVFAKRFINERWEPWEHACDELEVEAVIDSARAKADHRSFVEPPTYVDYLEGALYIFDVACGQVNDPQVGDLRVHGVSVDGVLIGSSDELIRLFADPEKAA